MEVIPAIDLRDGRCVRLIQGDYARETVFADDPLEMALRWEAEGAPRLHIVDLDGARTGWPANHDAISRISSSISIPLQVGGGIRTMEDADRLVRSGVDRLVLGTSAVRDPDLVARLCEQVGGQRIIAAVDAREGKVAVQGWLEDTDIAASDLVRDMAGLGVGRFLYTDIARDGTLSEPNFASIGQLVRQTSHPILASGGVSILEHVARLAQVGAEGAILGRALYTGDVDLAEAIRAAQA